MKHQLSLVAVLAPAKPFIHADGGAEPSCEYNGLYRRARLNVLPYIGPERGIDPLQGRAMSTSRNWVDSVEIALHQSVAKLCGRQKVDEGERLAGLAKEESACWGKV